MCEQLPNNSLTGNISGGEIVKIAFTSAVDKFKAQFPYLCRLNLGILALLSTAESLKLLVFNRVKLPAGRYRPCFAGQFSLLTNKLAKITD